MESHAGAGTKTGRAGDAGPVPGPGNAFDLQPAPYGGCGHPGGQRTAKSVRGRPKGKNRQAGAGDL